jgi:hypothetical protein
MTHARMPRALIREALQVAPDARVGLVSNDDAVHVVVAALDLDERSVAAPVHSERALQPHAPSWH